MTRKVQQVEEYLEYKELGSTGLKVSRIALGTVELGLDYGFRGSRCYTRPEPEDSIRILHRAIDLGINLIDTARTYGTSEELIGKALHGLRKQTVIASKVDIPTAVLAGEGEKCLRNKVLGSIECSLKALKVEAIDLMQIHETDLAILASDVVLKSLEDARQQGKIRFIGASCRNEQIALAALEKESFDVFQVPFNLLNRGMCTQVFSGAKQRRLGLLARSIFLRGVLTDNVNSIPNRLSPLKKAALQALGRCRAEVQSLSEMALRFALAFDEVTSVILGVRSIPELESNIVNSQKGPLSCAHITELCRISVSDSSLMEPQMWSDLI